MEISRVYKHSMAKCKLIIDKSIFKILYTCIRNLLVRAISGLISILSAPCRAGLTLSPRAKCPPPVLRVKQITGHRAQGACSL